MIIEEKVKKIFQIQKFENYERAAFANLITSASIFALLIIIFHMFNLNEDSQSAINVGVMQCSYVVLSAIFLFYCSSKTNHSPLDSKLNIDEFIIFASKYPSEKSDIIRLLKMQKEEDILNNLSYINEIMEDKDWFFKHVSVKSKIDLLNNKNFLEYIREKNKEEVKNYFKEEMDLIKLKKEEYKEIFSLLNLTKSELKVINI